MIVNVTQQHIARGLRGNGRGCPIALAVRDADPANVDVEIGIFYIWINGTRFEYPNQARLFRLAFYRGDPVQPFTFEL